MPLGRSKTIGSIHQRNDGPIQDLRLYISAAMLGPCKASGSISQMHLWAHSRLLTECLWSTFGPIRDYWKHVSGVPLGPSKTIGSIHRSNEGPIQDLRLYISAAMLGPCKAFGSISQVHLWAHSRLLNLLGAVLGPCKPLVACLRATVDPFKTIGRIFEEQKLAHSRPSAAFLGELCWAHWKHSAALPKHLLGPSIYCNTDLILISLAPSKTFASSI